MPSEKQKYKNQVQKLLKVNKSIPYLSNPFPGFIASRVHFVVITPSYDFTRSVSGLSSYNCSQLRKEN